MTGVFGIVSNELSHAIFLHFFSVLEVGLGVPPLFKCSKAKRDSGICVTALRELVSRCSNSLLPRSSKIYSSKMIRKNALLQLIKSILNHNLQFEKLPHHQRLSKMQKISYLSQRTSLIKDVELES